MNEIGMPKQWTEEQWSRVQQAVHDQALKTRVAARFLPLVGPLPPGTATVPAERVIENPEQNSIEKRVKELEEEIKQRDNERRQIYEDLAIALIRIALKDRGSKWKMERERCSKRLADIESEKIKTLNELARLAWSATQDSDTEGLGIDDGQVLQLLTVAFQVRLTSVQQSEPDLASALTLFARAANIVARTEDSVIFQGMDPQINQDCTVSPPPPEGNSLLYVNPGNAVPILCQNIPCQPSGDELVNAVATGVANLDSQGYLAPYALALGKDLFVAAETPSGDGIVLPSDRIRPLIEGPLLRSGSLPPDKGILVSLPGNPIEIVVASDIHVRFLQVTDQSEYLYRVSQRFVLRIKEPDAIVVLEPSAPSPTARSLSVGRQISAASPAARSLSVGRQISRKRKKTKAKAKGKKGQAKHRTLPVSRHTSQKRKR